MFFSLCVRRILSAYACKILRMQGLSCIRIVPSRIPKIEHFSSFLICFSSVCSFNIILHHFWTQMYVSCHISSCYAPNITFLPFPSPNHEFNLILFLQVSALYFGRGSTSQVLVWYSLLNDKTWGHISAAGFELVVRLMLKRSASAALVQTLVERWWDITHIFHIAG